MLLRSGGGGGDIKSVPVFSWEQGGKAKKGVIYKILVLQLFDLVQCNIRLYWPFSEFPPGCVLLSFARNNRVLGCSLRIRASLLSH